LESVNTILLAATMLSLGGAILRNKLTEPNSFRLSQASCHRSGCSRKIDLKITPSIMKRMNVLTSLHSSRISHRVCSRRYRNDHRSGSSTPASILQHNCQQHRTPSAMIRSTNNRMHYKNDCFAYWWSRERCFNRPYAGSVGGDDNGDNNGNNNRSNDRNSTSNNGDDSENDGKKPKGANVTMAMLSSSGSFVAAAASSEGSKMMNAWVNHPTVVTPMSYSLSIVTKHRPRSASDLYRTMYLVLKRVGSRLTQATSKLVNRLHKSKAAAAAAASTVVSGTTTAAPVIPGGGGVGEAALETTALVLARNPAAAAAAAGSSSSSSASSSSSIPVVLRSIGGLRTAFGGEMPTTLSQSSIGTAFNRLSRGGGAGKKLAVCAVVTAATATATTIVSNVDYIRTWWQQKKDPEGGGIAERRQRNRLPLPLTGQNKKAAQLSKEVRALDQRGQVFKAKALLMANKDINFTNPDDIRLKNAVLQRADDAQAIMREISDDSSWVKSYDNNEEQFETLYRHRQGETVHGIKMRAVFNSSVTNVLAVLREFDLTQTWNGNMKGAAQLGFPSPVSVQAYGAGFMPWGPFKTRDVLFNGYGADALDEHGCVTLVFQSTKKAMCALPPISKHCVRADFRRSGVVLEPLPPIPGAKTRVLASLVLNGDPKMAVPGWLASFGLKVFAPKVKRDTDELLAEMQEDMSSPYVMRKKQYPELYAMLDDRCEEYLSRTSRAFPMK